jgi:hypothetical protein
MAMFAMIAVPAGIALHTVKTAAVAQISSANPTPHGYTWSLLLFIVPIMVIGWWFLPSEGIEIPQRAFWRTIWILVPIGCGLDFFLAHRFFIFPNAGATLGIGAPALCGPVPIEEYIFYFTGFVAILLIYIWLDEYWLVAYNVPDYKAESQQITRLLQFHPWSLVVGIVLIMAAIIYKKFHSPEGFPGYFTVLVLGGLVPSALHQLARLQPDRFHDPAHQHVLGSNVGRALRMVGISARSDDGIIHRCMGKSAD